MSETSGLLKPQGLKKKKSESRVWWLGVGVRYGVQGCPLPVEKHHRALGIVLL